MSDNDGFGVDVDELRSFSGRLGRLAEAGRALATTLAGVTANTGREDSDQMGRLGPTDVSDVIGGIADEMANDGELITKRADLYEEIDSRSSEHLATLYP
jgi:hypothetical protein